MRFSISVFLLAFFSTGFSPSSAAEGIDIDPATLSACKFSTPPMLIDGNTASKPEMEELSVAVRTYIAEMQASLDCLKAAADAAESREQAIIHQLYNNGVEQLNFVAGEYNEQVRAYDRYRLLRPTN